jgi:hypothetical protein
MRDANMRTREHGDLQHSRSTILLDTVLAALVVAGRKMKIGIVEEQHPGDRIYFLI